MSNDDTSGPAETGETAGGGHFLNDEHVTGVLEPRQVCTDARAFVSLSKDDCAAHGFTGAQCRPGLGIPSHDVHGELKATILRADEPRTGSNGKLVKYDRPGGIGNWIDVPPQCREAVLDVAVPLDICEGPLKVDSLLCRGSRAVIGIHGVNGYRETVANNGKTFVSDFAHIPVNVRKVRIIFDSDTQTNRRVQAAALELKKYLEARKAVVSIVVLPHADDGSKQGVDDWTGTYEELAALEQSSVPGGTMVLPPPNCPHPVAEAVLNRLWTTDDGKFTLVHYQAEWMRYTGTHWDGTEDAHITAQLRHLLNRCVYETESKDELGNPVVVAVPWNPNRKSVGEVLAAMESTRFVRKTLAFNTWRYGPPSGAVGPFVAMADGIFDLGARVLYPSTPDFFTTTALPFAYDPEATCPEWEKFLDSLWPDDVDSRELLREWCGYVVSGRTDLHTILYLQGPTRGGRGTIARTLTALVGANNAHSTTMAAFSGHFGMQGLIGKSLGIIADARWSGEGVNVVLERMLTISGEDNPAIPRKNREDWTGKHLERLMVMSNDPPKVRDDSAAIVGRLLLLRMTESFLGREDRGLGAKLMAELPGIFNWALVGLDRLNEHGGQFTEPAISAEERTALLDEVSPVQAFVREQCVVGAEYTVTNPDLYIAWKMWCGNEGRDYPGTSATFIRSLRSVVKKLTRFEPTVRGKQVKGQRGIGLKSRQPTSDTSANTSDTSANTSANTSGEGGQNPSSGAKYVGNVGKISVIGSTEEKEKPASRTYPSPPSGLQNGNLPTCADVFRPDLRKRDFASDVLSDVSAGIGKGALPLVIANAFKGNCGVCTSPLYVIANQRLDRTEPGPGSATVAVLTTADPFTIRRVTNSSPLRPGEVLAAIHRCKKVS